MTTKVVDTITYKFGFVIFWRGFCGGMIVVMVVVMGDDGGDGMELLSTNRWVQVSEGEAF